MCVLKKNTTVYAHIKHIKNYILSTCSYNTVKKKKLVAYTYHKTETLKLIHSQSYEVITTNFTFHKKINPHTLPPCYVFIIIKRFMFRNKKSKIVHNYFIIYIKSTAYIYMCALQVTRIIITLYNMCYMAQSIVHTQGVSKTSPL